MRVVIIEDEAPAAARLRKMLAAAPFEIEVLQVLDTIAAARGWLGKNSTPDLLLMDIQLGDGLSLDLAPVGCPVIFITAYDDYWQQAFEHNSIDYLLKPVKQERLEAALRKFDDLRSYFSKRYGELIRYHGMGSGPAHREKFLVRRGSEYLSIPAAEIAYFYASHKVVCLVRKDGVKCILDQSLADIEKQVDPSAWYRVSRKYLVNRQAIRRMNALPKSKIRIEVEPAVKEELVVSSENSAGFKKWMGK